MKPDRRYTGDAFLYSPTRCISGFQDGTDGYRSRFPDLHGVYDTDIGKREQLWFYLGPPGRVLDVVLVLFCPPGSLEARRINPRLPG